MKNIILSVVLLALFAVSIAQSPTPAITTTASATTTSTPGTTLAPGSTSAPSPPGPSPSGPNYSLFGSKLGNANNGSAIILIFYNGATTYSYYMMHNIDNPTSIVLRGNGVEGDATAPVLVTLAGSAKNTLITGTFPLTGAAVGWMFENKITVDILSGTNSVLRGPVGYAPFTGWRYAGILNNLSTNSSSSSGVGLMLGGAGGGVLGFNIQHNVTDASSVTLRAGAKCQTGTIVFSFTQTGPSLYQEFTITQQNQNDIEAGNFFAQINTPTFTNGAIRGQIYPFSKYTNADQRFEDNNCQQFTTRAPSSAAGVAPSIILVVVAIIASLFL